MVHHHHHLHLHHQSLQQQQQQQQQQPTSVLHSPSIPSHPPSASSSSSSSASSSSELDDHHLLLPQTSSNHHHPTTNTTQLIDLHPHQLLHPSISLSLSSLSSTKPSSASNHLHLPSLNSASSSSASSSTCSSPPSYKLSTLPPFYSHQATLYRSWSSPLRHLRSHPFQFLKSRLSQLILLSSIFSLGYLIGSRSSSSSSSALHPSNHLARLVLRQPHIPFLVNLSNPPSPSSPSSLLPPSSSQTLARSNQKIPSILHYVFGLTPDFGGKPFGFIHYASIQSAVQILRPKQIHFHYHHLPKGWWFDRAQEIDGFKLVKERDVTEIYGRPVKHFAHKADIIRLEALRDYGGIYLDLDVFVVRNFDSLLNLDVVLGQEARPHPTFSRRPGSESVDEPVGLCNAVILSKPFSPFITRWLSSYRNFNHHRWADHSSVIPWALAQAHPDELTVLGPRAFFYPLWHEDDLWLVHKTTDWDFDRSGQFVYHAWSSISHSNYLQSLDPDRIHASGGPERGESSFTYFVRRFIHDSIREEWRNAKSNRTLGM